MENRVLILIPARLSSESMPAKNLKKVAGWPLLGYCLDVVKGLPYNALLTTDHDRVIDFVRANFPDLPLTKEPHSGVLTEVCGPHAGKLNPRDIVVLIQPTSPLIRRLDVISVVRIMQDNQMANSAQTITLLPHNDHAWNHRRHSVLTNITEWVHGDKRRVVREGKQDKPTLWKFGNVVATRAEFVKEDFFAYPSIGIPIERRHCFDCDGPEDFWMLDKMMKGMSL